MQLAKDAASAVDGLVSDLSTSIAAAKRDASSSSKAASVAFDGLVASLIQKSQGVKDVLVHSNTEAAAKVDTIIGSFASTATGLRKEASNRTLSWDVAFDRVSACVDRVTARSPSLKLHLGRFLFSAAGASCGSKGWQ
jgi:hypothetical protein